MSKTDKAPDFFDQDALDSELLRLFDKDEIIPLDLFTACLIGDYDAVKKFIVEKVDLNRLNMYGGWTPLMYASYVGKDTVLNLLLEEEVDVNIVSPSGMTALMLAAKCGNESVVYFLLQHNAYVDAADKQGQTSLFHAVRQDHTSVVKLLLDSGADFEKSPARTRITPLMEAAIEGNEVAFSLLLEYGANINAKSATGETARSLAVRYGNTMIVNIADNSSRTPDRALRSEPDLGDADIGISDGPKQMKQRGRQIVSPVYVPDPANDPYGSLGFPVRDIIPPIDANDQEPVEDTGNGGDATNGVSLENNVHENTSESQESGITNDVHLDDGQVILKEETSEVLPHQQPQSRRRIITELPKNVRLPEEQNQDPETVSELLQRLSLSKYSSCFDDNNIDLVTLVTFEEQDLKKIGIDKFGPRRKLLGAIHELRGKPIQPKAKITETDRLRNQLQQEQQSRLEMQSYLLAERRRMEQILHTVKELHKNCSEAASQLACVRVIHSDVMKRLSQYKVEGKLDESSSEKDNDKHVMDLHKTIEGQLAALNSRMSMTAKYSEQTLLHMISPDNQPTGSEGYS